MVNFYGNITLRTGDRQRVVELLNRAMRAAFVSPVVQGCVNVYESESDGDCEALWKLAGQLSRNIECIALAVMNHEDDLLLYQLFDTGELIDSYDSCPSFSGTSSSSHPRGGEAAILSNAFGLPQAEQALRKVLEKKYVTATNQHLDIVHLLQMNEQNALLGYNELTRGSEQVVMFEPMEEDDAPLPRVFPVGFVRTGDSSATSNDAHPNSRAMLRRLQRQDRIESAFSEGSLHFERMNEVELERILLEASSLTMYSGRPGFEKGRWLTIGQLGEALDFVLAASDNYLAVLSLSISGGNPFGRRDRSAAVLTRQQVEAVTKALQELDFEVLLSSYSSEEFEAALLKGVDSRNLETSFEQLRVSFRQLREFFAIAAGREELVIRYKS